MGELVIVGGAMGGVKEIYERIVDLAGGGGCRLGVIPLASGDPHKSWTKAREEFKKYGAKPALIDLTTDNYKINAYSKGIVEAIEGLDGVFFTGGVQKRIIDGLIDADGRDTPALMAIRRLYLGGGLISGNSAGAAVMSDPMIFEGIDERVEIGRGLGFFMRDEAIVDQHIIFRGRLTRLVEALWRTGVKLGFGIDEGTAIAVSGDDAEVVGESAVILLERNVEERGTFNFSYLCRGDKINLNDLTVKVTGFKEPMEPRGEAKRLYETNILSPSGPYVALMKLAKNKAERIETYALRLEEETAEGLEGYGYIITLEKKGDTGIYYGEKPNLLKYQRITAVNLKMRVRRTKVKLELKQIQT